MSRPRLVFMGTPEFAAVVLRACYEVGDVVAVVTQPDRPRGRGQAVTFSPVKEEALRRGTPVLQPAKLKTPPFSSALAEYRADLCVVAAYGRILPKDVLETPARGCLNLHGSLLPRWRGAAPVQRALAAGDVETGVCLMRMEEGLDTGAVLARRVVAIKAEDTSESLLGTLASLAAELIREELPRFLAGGLPEVPQSQDGVTLATMIAKEEGLLDFQAAASMLERKIRAFHPWPGAVATLGGVRVKVHKARVGTGVGSPGALLKAGPELEVACGIGSLVLLEVQPEGKRRMTAPEFLRGHALKVGG